MTGLAPLIVTHSDWLRYAAPQVDKAEWNVVIAAAGRGSRLGFNLPKILFPVAGRTILDWLLDLLLPCCSTAVFVLSPDGRKDVEPELERRAAGRYRICIQQNPTGMGDAIALGAAEVTAAHTAVIWGDQVAIRPASVDAVLRLHQGPIEPAITVPTVFRPNPYIHFERDGAGRIAKLLQAREGDDMPSQGESDTGFFCFRTEILRSLLAEMRRDENAVGARTGEFNLLPVIPFAAASGLRVLTPQLMEIEETVGINSPADASRIEPFLRRIHG
ncbi:MAG TPA: NTP transferase domain-containing protein [Bryobacteraceae bacterium]|nr:NTP transferase domain-containing protein [Bryobacteraceae bacterium]